MAKMQKIMDGQNVIGAVVHTPRYKWDKHAQCRDIWAHYLVYVTPAARRDPIAKQAIMDGVVASLAMQGVRPNNDDLGYPVRIAWGRGNR